MAVTRARPGRLDERLRSLGAEVVSVPTIAFVDADDGGAALRDAARRLNDGAFAWLVVTSATAVEFLDRAGGLPVPNETRIAAIGAATAAGLGRSPDIVPTRAVAENLVELFGEGSGRVLLLRPEVSRGIVGPGLRAKGWDVDEVTSYRTVAARIPAEARTALANAHMATFTSPSTVDGLVDAVGAEGLPRIVVAIGPVTARALTARGIAVDAIAEPHDVDGLVEAIIRVRDAPGRDG